ncbi:DUF1109 domain-containing protein [Caballeronia sp. INSB1]|jgi:hypothetical protein|uniref:DUF1109 domain-containing protein n=1 Tax=Caballeronia sp. INSB1 TaxID=2921751 RepID=UPI00203225DD|nr:DUF1109 domain-containing protein [Caballeronia sp. INSB1]
MKTDELIGLLSKKVAPIGQTIVSRRFAQALVAGALGSFILMSFVYGLRPDLSSISRTGIFWGKLAYPFAIAVGALLTGLRIGRPGVRGGASWAVISLPFVAVWIAGALVLDGATPTGRLPLVLGQSWKSCAFNITLLSVPTFPAVFWAMKSLAPTHLRIAGAVAGLLASSIATVVYCLHCPEMSPAFWSVWYTLGMWIPALMGAWIGPRALRW